MISFLTAMLVLQASQVATAPTTIVRTEMTGRLVISEEIGPAVAPYMGCLMKQQGIELRGAPESDLSKPGPGGDCAHSRAEAEKRADKLLRRKGGRSSVEREGLIEKTLLEMEGFANNVRKPVVPGSPANVSN